MFKQKQPKTSITQKLSILRKSEKFYCLYNKIKTFTLEKDMIICLERFFENAKTEKSFWKVSTSFNYYQEHQLSFDEYFSFGNELDRFIKNGKLVKIESTQNNCDKVVNTFSHSYGLFTETIK